MRLIIASFILSFVVAAATSCDDNDSVASSGYGIRVETAEVTAIASDNALSGGSVIDETQSVMEFGSAGQRPTIRPCPTAVIPEPAMPLHSPAMPRDS